MSNEMLRSHRSEMITQADILNRLVKIEDQLYRIYRLIEAMQADQANQRQEAVAVSMQQDQNRWEQQAP